MPDLDELRFSQRMAKIKALEDAVAFLTHDNPLLHECCGMPLSNTGECAHRSHHATPGNVNMVDYPADYNAAGIYIGRN